MTGQLKNFASRAPPKSPLFAPYPNNSAPVPGRDVAHLQPNPQLTGSRTIDGLHKNPTKTQPNAETTEARCSHRHATAGDVKQQHMGCDGALTPRAVLRFLATACRTLYFQPLFADPVQKCSACRRQVACSLLALAARSTRSLQGLGFQSREIFHPSELVVVWVPGTPLMESYVSLLCRSARLILRF